MAIIRLITSSRRRSKSSDGFLVMTDQPKRAHFYWAPEKDMLARHHRILIEFLDDENEWPSHVKEVSDGPPWMAEVDTIMTVDGKMDFVGPFKKCVYCGDTEYAPGQSRALGGEHSVMEGIGGTLELLEASCLECERSTGAFETKILQNIFEIPRRHMNVRTNAKLSGQKIKFRGHQHDSEVEIRLPFASHPKLIIMPTYHAPCCLSGLGTQRCNVSGFWSDGLRKAPPVNEEYRKIYSPEIDMDLFAQFLAKIAHTYAVSRVGLHKFRAELTGAIRNRLGKRGRWHERHYFVGGRPQNFLPSSALHELTLLYQRVLGVWMLVVRIRLFACMGAPVYLVVVGQWLGGAPPEDRVISITS